MPNSRPSQNCTASAFNVVESSSEGSLARVIITIHVSSFQVIRPQDSLTRVIDMRRVLMLHLRQISPGNLDWLELWAVNLLALAFFFDNKFGINLIIPTLDFFPILYIQNDLELFVMCVNDL